MQISIFCEMPECERHGDIINTVSGISPENMELFIEAWRGEDEADYCPSCYELGTLNDDTIRAEQPGEKEAYLATLPALPVARNGA